MAAPDRYRTDLIGPIVMRRDTRQRVCWWWRDGVRMVRGRGVIHGWRVGWTGVPVRYACIPDVVPADGGSFRVLEGLAMSLLRRGDMEGRGGPGPRPLTDPAFSGDYPLLWSYLTQNKWEDGSPRQTSSVLLFADDGVLKMMLRDRDAGLCLWVAGATVTGLFDAVEGALADAKADWRQDRVQKGDTAKRRGKAS